MSTATTERMRTTLRRVRYVRTTNSGAPQFWLFTDGGNWRTLPDAQVNWDSLVNRGPDVTYDTVDEVDVTLQRHRGRMLVVGIEAAD